MTENEVKELQSTIRAQLDEDIPASKKSMIINFFLDIIHIAKQLPDISNLTAKLVKIISKDLSGNLPLATLCKDWSMYVRKIKLLDEQKHEEMLSSLRSHLESLAPQSCFETFVEEGEEFSVEVSDLLFHRTLKTFHEKEETRYDIFYRKYDESEHQIQKIYFKCPNPKIKGRKINTTP